MMRRGFWVAVGAVAGITGYRRAGQLARVVAPRRRPGALPLIRVELGWPQRRAAADHLAAGRGQPSGAPGAVLGAAAFLRDVRDGMAEYLEQREAGPRAATAPRLASEPHAALAAGQARQPHAARRGRQARGRRPAAPALPGRAARPDDAKDGP